MAAVVQQPLAPADSAEIPPLFNGDHLSSAEFLRRYETMPEVKKAELVDGRVFMASPTSLMHAKPDALLQSWLGFYAAYAPKVEHCTNATLVIDDENTVQPDGLLYRVASETFHTNSREYLRSVPELVVEISVSSASLDMHEKRALYERAGVQEYIVWTIAEKRIRYFILESGKYREQIPDADGVIQSRVFPGLALNIAAALEMNSGSVLDSLQTSMRAHGFLK